MTDNLASLRHQLERWDAPPEPCEAKPGDEAAPDGNPGVVELGSRPAAGPSAAAPPLGHRNEPAPPSGGESLSTNSEDHDG